MTPNQRTPEQTTGNSFGYCEQCDETHGDWNGWECARCLNKAHPSKRVSKQRSDDCYTTTRFSDFEITDFKTTDCKTAKFANCDSSSKEVKTEQLAEAEVIDLYEFLDSAKVEIASLPPSRNSPGFDALRILKKSKGLKDLDSLIVAEAIEGWMSHRGSGIDWTFLDKDLTDEEAHCVLLSRWGKVRYAPGENDLSKHLKIADDAPLDFPRHLSRLKGFVRLVSLSYYRQLASPNVPFKLTQDILARLLGCSQTHVSDLIQIAVQRGYLIPVSKGVQNMQQAATYRFNNESAILKENRETSF